MTNDEQQQQNALIAEALEAQGLGIYAWAPAKECPQGHPNRDDRGIAPDRGIGQLCMKCLIWNDYIGRKFPSEEQHRDKTWHPEWRFDRVPRDFARDSSLLLHAGNLEGGLARAFQEMLFDLKEEDETYGV